MSKKDILQIFLKMSSKVKCNFYTWIRIRNRRRKFTVLKYLSEMFFLKVSDNLPAAGVIFYQFFLYGEGVLVEELRTVFFLVDPSFG